MNDDAEFDHDGDDVDVGLNDESADESSVDTSSQDALDGYSTTARELMRKQLQSDVEAFLAAGGEIAEVPSNVVSDPPRKPQSNYGGQPI